MGTIEKIKRIIDKANKKIAKAMQLLAPGSACCVRCNRPWRFVRKRSTSYGPGKACAVAVLCKWCWRRLSTQERLHYYNNFIEELGFDEKSKEKIRNLVLMGN